MTPGLAISLATDCAAGPGNNSFGKLHFYNIKVVLQGLQCNVLSWRKNN